MVDDYGSTKTPVNHEGANRKEGQLAMFDRCRCLEGRWKRLPCAVLCAVLCACGPTAVAAQARDASASDPPAQGTFPDASFDATFRKYTPPENVFSPFYSWDAQMALSLTTFRKGAGAVTIAGFFQSVGTENLGSRVSVGGTGYLLGFGYVHTYSARFKLSAGFRHFSSHLTRDLDDKLEEERNKGETIPEVDDPSEFNVIFLSGSWKLSSVRFAPEIEVVVQPINFKFNGSPADDIRPIYLGTRWTLWRGDQKSIVAETRQEFGENPLNNFTLSFGLFAREQPEGRLQIFVSASPGGNLHVSPNFGALRDGVAFGIRLHFRA
jgi:hypothetical protein